MTQLILSSLCITFSCSMMVSFNPLTSGLLILCLALSIASLYASLISSWYAFLIFLIYIGGMLVMFSYFVALNPNQEKISMNPSTSLFLLSVTTSLVYTNQPPALPFQFHSMFNLYISAGTTILLLLALLLLLTMVIVVKITNLSKGPLRPFL